MLDGRFQPLLLQLDPPQAVADFGRPPFQLVVAEGHLFLFLLEGLQSESDGGALLVELLFLLLQPPAFRLHRQQA